MRLPYSPYAKRAASRSLFLLMLQQVLRRTRLHKAIASLLDADAGCVVPVVSVTDEELSVHDHFLCVIGAEEEFFNPFGYRFEVVSLAVDEEHTVEVVFS